MDNDFNVQPLSETENYMVFSTQDDEGETIYHVEVFNITLHFYKDEWNEFLALLHSIPSKD